jgi:hypothetical protein
MAAAGEASNRRATTERTRDMPAHQPWRGNFVNVLVEPNESGT